MPDDVKVEDVREEVKPEPVVEEKVVEEKPVEYAPAADSPRFKEVYARMKQAEAREADLLGRINRLETAAKPVQPQESFYTADQLQGFVDAGRMTQLQAADRLAYQRATAGSRATIQIQAQERVNEQALSEVNRYLEKMPSLGNVGSSEFQAVSAAAHAYSAEVGWPVTDPRVQRRALRETFGPLEKVAKVERRETPHSESGGGGGSTPTSPTTNPLKGVSQAYLDFWKKRGYTQKQMEEEAKYITRQEPRITQT